MDNEMDSYVKNEFKRLQKKVDELKEDAESNGIKIWTLESNIAINLDIPEELQKQEFKRLKDAIDNNLKTVKIQNFCIVVDKITSFKWKGDNHII